MNSTTSTIPQSVKCAYTRLQDALNILQPQNPSQLPDENQTYCTSFVATAFTNTSVSVLQFYKAAACLREGQLRQIVQHLLFQSPKQALIIVRILLIMRGLYGNRELTLQFMQKFSIDQLLSFPIRFFTIIALLAGSNARKIWDWTPILNRVFTDMDVSENRLCAAILSNNVYDGPKEYVLELIDWDSEHNFADDPSFWREIRWAEFARVNCINAPNHIHSDIDSDAVDQHELIHPVQYLDASIGPSAQHYVQVCDVLLPLRIHKGDPHQRIKSVSDVSMSEAEHNQLNSIVFTPTIISVFRQLAISISYGLPIILEGPSGCGKSALITYLANIINSKQHTNTPKGTAPGITFIHMDSNLSDSDGDLLSTLIGEVVPLPEGRGFHWRPGPIGLAVEQGNWIVFENVASSSITKQSSIAALIKQLALIQPGDTLDAPGRGEPIPVATGFRCILTRTLEEHDEKQSWIPPAGWENWERIQLKGLDHTEQADMLRERYQRVADCVERVLSATQQVAEYVKLHMGHLLLIPSLREAVRICKRLSLTRESTGSLSAESAYLETMDVLAAACPAFDHLMKLIEIISSCWSISFTVAQDLFFKHRPELVQEDLFLKVGRAKLPKTDSISVIHSSRLLRTGHTLRLVERVVRSIQNGEHVLLTGETGSGKTTMIQEIASQLGKKLYVVNMSRQSELTDLVGGFKPVDTSISMSLIVKKFEELFSECMPRSKNERFLDAVQKASRSSRHHDRALRLMKGALNAMPGATRHKSADIVTKWNNVSAEIETMKLVISPSSKIQAPKTSVSVADEGTAHPPPKKRPRVASDANNDKVDTTQNETKPKKSTRRMDFKFSEGTLVQAMREGNWILLDEINLAPNELLERLVAVLERGELPIANEKAELVSQAPGFTVLGAMNPPTDVGKKPLPNVLRNKFSEINVPDLTDSEEIAAITLQRIFRSSNINSSAQIAREKEQRIAADVARFFSECHHLSVTGQLEDCTGKPLRFSLRTLSRMLDFAANTLVHLKTGYKGIRRLLFEGALLAFVTPLLGEYRKKVISLAASILLSKKGNFPPKLKLLSEQMALPETQSTMILIEGFPIEKHPASKGTTERKSETFIITPTVQRTLCDVSRGLMFGSPKLPILLQGPTATGKTSLISYLADLTGTKLTRINNHEHTELSEYLGSYTSTTDGSLVFREGPLVRAVRNGEWIVLDELNLAPPDVLEALNRLLDDNREIFLPETGEVVKAAKNFRLFATQNPPGVYGGRKELSKAFRSRFIEVQVGDLPDDDLLTILEAKGGIPSSFAKKMIMVMRELQIRRRATGLFSGREGFITARDLFRWASRQPRTKEELAVHGFYLLGERARRSRERDLIRNVIVKETNVSLDTLSESSLYSFSRNPRTDTPTEECLDASLKKLGVTRHEVFRSFEANDIVLTPHMKRTAVLVIHSVANSEPVLLVGTTGGGKTSCCGAICDIIGVKLRTINCHKNTEASDILGAYRPTRSTEEDDALFEWADGPLVLAMKEGSAFLIDEVNMADDAVVERLNSVLEPQRTLLLSERGVISSNKSNGESLEPELIIASSMFRLMATMNPGGDFGKRELSPALRNRFTELWVPGPCVIEDYSPIVLRTLDITDSTNSSLQLASKLIHAFLERYIAVKSGKEYVKCESDTSSGLLLADFAISLRDIKTWCTFIRELLQRQILDSEQAVLHGIRMALLDGLTVGSTSAGDREIESLLWSMITDLSSEAVKQNKEGFTFSDANSIQLRLMNTRNSANCLEAGPFSLERSADRAGQQELSYSFEAACTARNTARLLRAMSLHGRPILLEGPPGCGKTSLIQAISSIAGFEFIRVNLSEATELADLVGADAPSEKQGKFGFREGPLVRAMRNGSWLLLDELNLASQSVLEGLNSVLDHRKCIFIPETKEEVQAHPNFKVFGAQNPPSDGGGRRGLPQSFLNRFSKVHVEAPIEEDVKDIVEDTNPSLPKKVTNNIITTLTRTREEMEIQHHSSVVFGLRDILRWCDLLTLLASRVKSTLDRETERFSTRILQVSFDVIILQSLCDEKERAIAVSCFEEVFGIPWDANNSSPSIYSSSNFIRVGEAHIKRKSSTNWAIMNPIEECLLESQSRELQAIAFAIEVRWPIILLSSLKNDVFENRRCVQTMATLSGRKLFVIQGSSLIDSDEFLGGYTQQDTFRSLRRACHGIEYLIEKVMSGILHQYPERSGNEEKAVLSIQSHCLSLKKLLKTSAITREVRLVNKQGVDVLQQVVKLLQSVLKPEDNHSMMYLKDIEKCKHELEERVAQVEDTSSVAFQWQKSELLQAIEKGHWLLIEDADECSPAILDRLNPIFERAAMSVRDGDAAAQSMTSKGIILAEAPSKKDGSPETLNPHPHFRMFFSLSTNALNKDNFGLSPALLDRSLKVRTSSESSLFQKEQVFQMKGLLAIHTDDDKVGAGEEKVNKMSEDADDRSHVEKTRFRLASNHLRNRSAKTTSSLEDGDHFKMIVRPKRRMLGTIPRSGAFDFIQNFDTVRIDRDVTGLRMLETALLEDVFEHSNLKLSITSSDDGMRVLTGAQLPQTYTEESIRSRLLLGSSQAFLLGAASHKDLQKRIEVLSSLRTRPGKESLLVEYQLTELAGAKILAGFGSEAWTCNEGLLPLDPISSMDVASARCWVDILEDHDLKKVQHKARQFRLELFCVQALQQAWREASQGLSSTCSNTMFRSAERASRLWKKTNNIDHLQVNSSVVLCYDVVNLVHSKLDRIMEYLITSNGWKHPQESAWIKLILAVTNLCELLKAPATSSPAKFISGLSIFVAAIENVSQSYPSCLQEPLSLLQARIRESVNILASEGSRTSVLLLPRTAKALDAETNLYTTMKETSRTRMNPEQIDAIVRGIVSLRITQVAENEQLLESFQKLSSALVRQSSKRPENSARSYWGRIVFEEVLSLIESLVLTNGINLLPAKTHQSPLPKVLYRAKHISDVSLDTLVSLQHLKWADDDAVSENSSNNREKYSLLWDTILLTNVIAERSKLLMDDMRSGSMIGNYGCGIVSWSLRRAADDTVPLWNISRFLADSPAISLSLGCRISTKTEKEIRFKILQTFIASTCSLISSKSTASDESSSSQNNWLPLLSRLSACIESTSHLWTIEGPLLRACTKEALKSIQRLSDDSIFEDNKLSSACDDFDEAKVWILVSLLRIIHHREELHKMMSIDPAEVASEIGTFAKTEHLSWLTKCVSFAIMNRHRFGGDIAQNSPVIRQMMEVVHQDIEIGHTAHQFNFERPENKASLTIYEAAIENMNSTLVQSLLHGRLFEKLSSEATSENLQVTTEELQGLSSSCQMSTYATRIGGEFSHFRDLSYNFILGITSIQYGLQLATRACQKELAFREKTTSSRIELFSDLSMFPRLAFNKRFSLRHTIEKCIDGNLRGHVVLKIALLHLSYISDLSDIDYAEVSSIFAILISLWRQKTAEDEEERERKDSFYVIREANNESELPSSAWANDDQSMLDQDFEKTFNPLNEHDEEELLGINSENSSTTSTEPFASTKEINTPRIGKFKAEEFWHLHRMMFLPKSLLSKQVVSEVAAHSKLQILYQLSGHLSHLCDGTEVVIDGMESLWPLLASGLIMQKLNFSSSSQVRPQSQLKMNTADYNFYTDGNPAELVEASSRLEKLQERIEVVQTSYFEGSPHPVLQEIGVLTTRVSTYCKVSTPLSTVVVGLENVLRKVDEWRRIFATSAMRMDDEVTNLARLVARWRKKEMESWRFLLEDRLHRFQKRAQGWFMLLFDAVTHRGLEGSLSSEKHRMEIVSLIDQFLRSSPRGEFCMRLEMISSLIIHLRLTSSETKEGVRNLTDHLSGIVNFYSLYADSLTKMLGEKMKQSQKKLKEFTTLVSWNYTSELGSGQKMSKEYDKNLEYYRLKSAAERTRRRLHKLCQEIDAELKTPVFSFISEKNVSIGFSSLFEAQDHFMVTLGSKTDKFFVFSATKELEVEVPSDNQKTISKPGSIPNSLPLDKIEKKIPEFAKLTQNTKNSSCDHAIVFCSRTNQNILTGARIIQDTSQDVQVKKRALVDLLHSLKNAGLSPYNKKENESNNLDELISSPCLEMMEEYKHVECHLYTLSILYFQRLNEAVDSRFRSNDITNQEAMCMKNYARNLVQQASAKRKALHHISDQIAKIRLFTETMESLQSYSQEQPTLDSSYKKWKKLCEAKRRLKSIGSDLSIFQQTLSVALESFEEGTASKDLHSMARLQSYRSNQKDCKKMLELLQDCMTGITEITDNLRVSKFEDKQVESFAQIDAGLGILVEEETSKLVELLSNVRTLAKKASTVSIANVANKTLIPTVHFLETTIASLRDSEHQKIGSEDLVKLMPHFEQTADQLLKKIQISVQRALEWTGNYTSGILQNEIVEKKFDDSENGIPLNVLMLSHKRSLSFASHIQLKEILDVLHDISHHVSQVDVSGAVKSCPTYKELVLLQRSLGAILRLCKEGYCRPPPQDEENEENEMEVDGAGFGEAGDGDMSGAKNVSDEIDDEEQLLGLKPDNPNENQDQDNQEQGNDEDGFDMTNDFDGQLENMKDTDKDDHAENENEDQEPEKQLSSEDGIGDEVIDEKLWDGDDHPEQPNKPHDSSRTEQQAPDAPSKDMDLGAKESEENANAKDNKPDPNDQSKQNNELEAQSVENEENNEESREEEHPDNTEVEKKKGGDKMDIDDPVEPAENEQTTEDNETENEQTNENQNKDSVADDEAKVEMEEQLDNDAAEKDDGDEIMMGNQGDAPSGNDVDNQDEISNEKETESGEEIPNNLNLDENQNDNNEDNLDTENNDEIESMSIDEEGEEDEDEATNNNQTDGESKQETTNSDDRNDDDDLAENIPLNSNSENKSSPVNEQAAYDLDSGTATTSQQENRSNETGAFCDRGTSGVETANDYEEKEERNNANGDASGQDQNSEKDDSKNQENLADKFANAEEANETWERKRSPEANPLRATAEELVVEWERLLNALDTDNKDDPSEGMDDGDKKGKGDMSQFDENADGMCAMGDATEDQQRSIPESDKMEEEDDSDDRNERSELIKVDGEANKNEIANSEKLELEQETETQNEVEAGDEEVLKDDTKVEEEATEDRPNRDHAKTISGPNDLSKNKFEDMDIDSIYDESKLEVSESQCKMSLNEGTQKWKQLERETGAQSRALCEQLRLILEATETKGLRGGYRSGRRLDMRRVIEYVASDFRRDRIWRRRTGMTGRNYDVMVCVDDSGSMKSCGASTAALEAVSIVSGALTRLEVGRVGVASFGTNAKIVRRLDEALPISMESGGKMLQQFGFDQQGTNICKLLELLEKELSSDSKRLALIVSDGRIEEREEVRLKVRRLKDIGILVALIIVDAKEDSGSVMKLKRVEYDGEGGVNVLPYLEEFPVEFYAVVDSVKEVPRILADAMRQWIEMMNVK